MNTMEVLKASLTEMIENVPEVRDEYFALIGINDFAHYSESITKVMMDTQTGKVKNIVQAALALADMCESPIQWAMYLQGYTHSIQQVSEALSNHTAVTDAILKTMKPEASC